MEPLPHAQDFANFATHVKLPERMRSFIEGRRRIVAAHLKNLEGLPEESWFTYWSTDYSDSGFPFLEFNWRYPGKELWPDLEWREGFGTPAYWELLEKNGLATAEGKALQENSMGRARERANQTILLDTWMNKRLSRMMLPEGISRLEFGPSQDWEGFILQVQFEHNVSPEPWEEGTPGYQI